METSLNSADIDLLIKKAEKRYGSAFGKLIQSGPGNTEGIALLASINADYNALLQLKEALTPKPVEPSIPVEEVPVATETADDEENQPYLLPEGICASESCTDEFCVEYWEAIENPPS